MVAFMQSFILLVSILLYSFWIKLSCVCYFMKILHLYSLFIWSISSLVDVFGSYSFLHKLQIIAITFSLSLYFLYINSQTAEVVFPLLLLELPNNILSSIKGSVISSSREISSLVLFSKLKSSIFFSNSVYSSFDIILYRKIKN